MEEYYIAKKIYALGKVGEPFTMDTEEQAKLVWQYLKDKKKFKKGGKTIWKIKE